VRTVRAISNDYVGELGEGGGGGAHMLTEIEKVKTEIMYLT